MSSALDTVTEVSSENIFTRLKNAIVGVFFGILFIIGGIVCLFWNEGRAVKTATGLNEGKGKVILVSNNKIDPENQNKLIHLTGLLTTTDTLNDAPYKIKTKALKLNRIVETYQFKENSKSESKEKIGGTKTTTTTYSYEKIWSKEIIKSDNFKEQANHKNIIKFNIASQEKTSKNVNLGVFNLSTNLIAIISGFEKMPITTFDTIANKQTTLNDGVIYMGSKNIVNPEIGDVRISFEIINPKEVSIIAAQVNNKLDTYTTKNGSNILMLSNGNVAATQMFKEAIEGNTILTWVLRLVGFIMLFIGFKLILSPIATVGSVLPLFGNILSFGTGIISFVLAAAIALIIIAIAWFIFRPILSIILIAAAIGIFFGVKYLKKKK